MKKYIVCLANAALLTLLAVQTARAQSPDIASNQVAETLDEAGAWISRTVPTATNFATWEGTYTAANCTNALAANATWGGIDIGSVTGAPIDITTANGSILTLDGIASGANLDTVDLSAATVDLTVGCEIEIGGGATNSFTVASGRTFTYAGSSALFFSLATGSTPAVLSLNGAGNYVFNGPLDTYVRLSGESNWPILEMNGTGDCSLNGSGHAMNFLLNSGTLNLNNIYDISGYSGQTLTITGGTIDNTSGGAIDIGNSDNNPLYNWDGNFAYGGTGALDLGPGAVTLGQNVQLTCNGTNTLTVDGAIGDNGSGYSLTKAGAGTLLLTGSSTYSGATTISDGTLALGSGASLAAGSSVSIAAGGTFNVSAISSYTLGSSAGLTASGTGTGSTAAAIGGALGGTVGLGSRPITLTYNGSQPALYISQGTLELDGNAFTVNGSALSSGTYTIVEQGSGNISSSGSYSVSGTALGSGSGSILVSGGNVILTVSGGIGGTNQTTTTTLSLTTGSNPQIYGGKLVFTATVMGLTTSPSGSVVFQDGSTPLFTNTLTAGTSPDSSATYTSYTRLGVNGGMAHSIAAYYQGDSTHNTSSSSGSPISQTITAKALTVTGLTADNKIYNGTTAATLSGTGVLLTPETPGSGMTSDGEPYTGDTVSVSGTPTGTFASPNVGNNISVSVTGLSLAGAQSGDYSLTEPALSADILSPTSGDIASNQVAETLDEAGAWISRTVPTATNFATWEGTYTAANCTNALAANATWGGIDIGSVTGAPIDITTANGSILTLDGIASGANLDTVDLSAATVDLTVGCEIEIGGGATNSFTVASGRTFTYAGSSALFFSLATGSTPAVLSLNGAGNYVFNGPLDTYVRLSGESNWPILEMNGTGDCSLNGSGHAMNFLLNSGTLNLNNIYDISGYSGQTLTITGGTIDNTSGGAIDIGNSDNNPLYNWDGNFAYGGTGALDLGPGAVTLGQNVQLTCNGTNTLTVDGAIGDNGSGYSLTKAGAGTLLLTGSSTYSGATTISDGTLALGSGASLAAGSSVSIAAGGTFNVSAISSYTLGSSAGLTASGTGTGSTAAAIGGALGGTVGLGSRPITLTYNGSQPALYISQGTLELDGNAFTVNGSTLSYGTYTIVEQVSGSISSSGSYSVSGTALGSGSGSILVSGGNVVLTVSGGIGGTNQTTTTTLSRTTGSGSQTYGSALTFTATVMGLTTSPGGSVVFQDGSTPLFTNTLTAGTSPDSSATYTSYTALGVGTHSIAAYYQGDSTHYASSSSDSPISQTITAKALTVTGLTADNKTYDGTTAATLSGTAALLTPEMPGIGTTSDGIPYTGDTVSMSGTPTGTFASPNVGNNISVSVTGLSLAGAQSGDYSLTEPALSADITGTNNNSSASASLWLTSSSQTNAYQVPVAFGATVMTNGAMALNATGNVTFLTNGVVFYTTNLVNGTADSPYSAVLPLGVSTITAQYTSGNYAGMTNTLEQVVMQQTSNMTFSNSLIEFTFNPLAQIVSITNVLTANNRDYYSQGFCLQNEQFAALGENYKISFSNMVEIASNIVLLSTSDGHYNVTFQVTCQPTYLKFALLNVSDSPSGGIDTNWIGWSVAFTCYAFPYVNDGWQIYALQLDPMVDLLSIDNPILALWPYVQYSQANAYGYPYINQPNSAITNGFPLQPMGALAIYGCATAAEHDSILYDIWGAEPSLPEPNRANLTNGWNRATAEAWVTNWLTSLPPARLLFLIPNDTNDLYTAANIMYADGLNGLYLFNAYWNGEAAVDSINTNMFPNGLSDVTAFQQYCAARGISLYFHWSSGWVAFGDPTYGAMSPTGLSSGLSYWATGTLLTDINSDSTSFNVQPDPGYQIFAPPPWGFDYDMYSAITLVDDYPPFYPAWLAPMINISNDLMFASVTEVNPTNWLVSDVTRTAPDGTPVGQFGSYWGENHTAGDHVAFIVSSGDNDFIPDSRSEVLTNLAVRYATLMNEENIANADYDALEQQQDLGNWGPRRFSKALYETLNHPVHANSSFGTAPWGHFEYNFDSVQQHDGVGLDGFSLESSEAAPMAQVRIWDPSLMASHLDEDQYCYGLQGSYSPNMSLGGDHVGTTVNTITNQGWWTQAVTNLDIWQAMQPYLTTNELALFTNNSPDFYVPTETVGGWELTPEEAMLRPGLDTPWVLTTETGPISPHQFMQVGQTLEGLNNPYDAQTPQVELLVLPGMTATNANNVQILPSPQTFTTGNPYNWSNDGINMSQSRGMAFTVTGDGSGSDLVLNIGGRYYVVTVNFTGTQTIEIPNGEVEMYRSPDTGYAFSGTIEPFNYTNTGNYSLSLGYVPSGVNPNITVSSIETMSEDQTTGLVSPTLTLNGSSVTINATIPYNDYVVYSGGSTASEYDANWNFQNTLPVSGSGLVANNGSNSFTVSASDSPNAWMAVRVKVSGPPMTINR